MNTTVADPQQRESLDLQAIFALLRAKWRWLLLGLVLFTALSVAAALLMTPVYRAAAVLIPANTDRNNAGGLSSALGALGGLAAIAGVSGADAGTEEALAVLRSRQFTEQFIVAEQLMPKLFASKWDQAAGKWKVAESAQPTPAKAYRMFDKKVRVVSFDKKTGLATLKIEWRDREEAAKWANELVRRLNAEMRSRAVAKANASLGFLEKELETTRVIETRQAISKLIETQIKQRMIANVTEEYSFRVVDRAMAPDADDPIRPRKVLMIAAAPILGAIASALLIVLCSMWSPANRHPASSP